VRVLTGGIEGYPETFHGRAHRGIQRIEFLFTDGHVDERLAAEGALQ
jgi:hypothetical protein